MDTRTSYHQLKLLVYKVGRADRTGTQLDLVWNQNTEPDLSYYNIYRGNSSGFSVTPGTTPPTGIAFSNSFHDTGLGPSTTYFYKVAAVDKEGNIGPLVDVEIHTPPNIVQGLGAAQLVLVVFVLRGSKTQSLI